MSTSPPKTDDFDDRQLALEVHQKGNLWAFDQLLDRHVHHLRAFLALRVPVGHLVDELTHETFVFAFRNIHAFTKGDSVQAWLRAIAWNLLRAEIQRFSREEANQARYAAHQICQSVTSAAETSSADEADFLEQCLRQVPSRMRKLLALKYREDRSSQEIARRLDQSVSWVTPLSSDCGSS